MDAISRLNDRLAGRYRIEREIGSGAMATVFLATSMTLNRTPPCVRRTTDSQPCPSGAPTAGESLGRRPRAASEVALQNSEPKRCTGTRWTIPTAKPSSFQTHWDSASPDREFRRQQCLGSRWQPSTQPRRARIRPPHNTDSHTRPTFSAGRSCLARRALDCVHVAEKRPDRGVYPRYKRLE